MCPQEFNSADDSMGIAREKLSTPRILGDSIETKKGMSRKWTPLLQIGIDPSHVPFILEDEDGRVQTENRLVGSGVFKSRVKEAGRA